MCLRSRLSHRRHLYFIIYGRCARQHFVRMCASMRVGVLRENDAKYEPAGSTENSPEIKMMIIFTGVFLVYEYIETGGRLPEAHTEMWNNVLAKLLRRDVICTCRCVGLLVCASMYCVRLRPRYVTRREIAEEKSKIRDG